MDEALRPLGRTSTTWPREATNPVRCARTRYGPGDSVRISNRPARSLTANAVDAPSAETIAPDTGAPRSSCTTPRIDPAAIDARCVTGRISVGLCATRSDGRQRSTRPPTTADAVILDALLMLTPRERRLRRADGEVQLPRQRLVRELVGDLDLEPVVACRERRQRHGLAALQLVAGGEIELRRQRLRVQVLRVRLVEELLRLADRLLVEVVLDADVGLV